VTRKPPWLLSRGTEWACLRGPSPTDAYDWPLPLAIMNERQNTAERALLLASIITKFMANA
jgi:hypothetical protein